MKLSPMESVEQGQAQADLIYDVGMHRGEDTEFYLHKGFRVVAFEADPELIKYCADKFADFIKAGKLKIIGGAIVDLDTIRPDEKGMVSFYKNVDVSVWGTVRSEWAQRNQTLGTTSSRIDVQAIDFAAVLRDYGIPHYMKIDIEGCDLVCLNALRRFTKRPDYISIESDKTSLAKNKA
jgi:FkbM family methyltransferase